MGPLTGRLWLHFWHEPEVKGLVKCLILITLCFFPKFPSLWQILFILLNVPYRQLSNLMFSCKTRLVFLQAIYNIELGSNDAQVHYLFIQWTLTYLALKYLAAWIMRPQYFRLCVVKNGCHTVCMIPINTINKQNTKC